MRVGLEHAAHQHLTEPGVEQGVQDAADGLLITALVVFVEHHGELAPANELAGQHASPAQAVDRGGDGDRRLRRQLGAHTTHGVGFARVVQFVADGTLDFPDDGVEIHRRQGAAHTVDEYL